MSTKFILRKEERDPFSSSKGERGMALFVSLGLITIFSLLAGGFMAVGLRSSHLAGDLHYSSSALSTAEAGVHFALGQLTSGEIVPPEPTVEDSSWMTWVHHLVTPEYGSEVEIRYIKELMMNHFKYDGSINEEHKYFRITSIGNGPRQTERSIEIVMKPEGLTPTFDYAFFFGGSANFSGNPVTFSGHFDTLDVKLAGNGKPYIDINGNGVFNQPIEWGWAHGIPNRLDMVKLSDVIPLVPPCGTLHYAGHIHSNGSINFEDNPHFNGKGSATGFITHEGEPFVNEDNSYFRYSHTNNAPPVEPIDIPTDLEYWEEVAEDDNTVHIITPLNVDDYPGWQYMGGAFKWGGNEKMEEGTYYLTDDVQISGNSSGNATIITNHTLKVSGTTANWSKLDLMGYISGGELTVNGGQYIQGLVYSKSNIKFPGEAYIFGAVWVKGGGEISGNPIVVFNTALKDGEWGWNYKPSIVSWQEIIP